MENKERFYFQVGECLAALDAKNTARLLLKRQAHLLYPRGRKPTEEEKQEITAKLRLVKLGIEKTNENLLDYKIRKQKEYKALLVKTNEEFPNFRNALHSIIQKRSQRVGDEKMVIQKLKGALSKSLYELFSAYSKSENHLGNETAEELFPNVPHIHVLIGSKDYSMCKQRAISMSEYHLDEFHEITDFIANNPEHFFSERVLNTYKGACSWSEETNDREVQKLVDMATIRMARFKENYDKYQTAIA